ncbi:hypothetical protein L2E82_29543 [Cichorium intybus]|uniref:Uncharacterized protein n=1 Tax=Cichorium intybus TaxID=13427 RepID=A0ACB9CXT5_CICIN|nr:hypothetical protein L2E82_29543 [Cichorium intybus]
MACIMIATMKPELERIYEDYWPYEMHKDLAEKFRKRARVERLRKLGMLVDEELAIEIVLNSLPGSYDQFTLAYHLNNTQASLSELYNMLQIAEDGMKGKSVPSGNQPVLAIGHGKGKKRKGPPRSLEEELPEILAGRQGRQSEADISRYGLKESREVEHGRLNLIMDNRRSSPVTKIGVYSLVLSNDVCLDLINCCYSPEMARNIISFHALFKQGFQFSFDNLNGSISVYKNGAFIFTTLPCDGVYETVTCVDNLGHSVLYIDSSSGVEKACLWHCRLGHINKKRIAQLQRDGVLESFDLKSDDVCESCLLGKMTKSPFKGSFERGEGLLDIIHTYVCSPFRSTIKDAITS